MTKWVLIILLFSYWPYTCTPQEKAAATPSDPASRDTTQAASIDFVRDIQPILKTSCNPCHFPGGKMYTKLPFDNPQTIRDHPEGIFKRIKGEEEVRKLKTFLENPNRKM